MAWINPVVSFFVKGVLQIEKSLGLEISLVYLLSCWLDASCMACDFRISLNHAMCTFWREETAFITQQTPISVRDFALCFACQTVIVTGH